MDNYQLTQSQNKNDSEQQTDFSKLPVVEEIEEDLLFTFDGFQVVRREFFAHLRDPSITFSNCKVSFNSACVNKLSDVDYVQFLVNPEKRMLAVRPCAEEDRDSFLWSKTKGNRKQPRQTTCKLFFAKLVSLMNWNPDYRYKLIGKVIKSNDEFLIVFDLTATEVYQRTLTDDNKYKASRVPVFPEEWKNQFGLPFADHQKSLQVDIFDGYAVYGYKDGVNFEPTVNKGCGDTNEGL